MQKVKIINNWEYYEYYDSTGKQLDPRGITEIMDRDGKVYPVTCRKITVEYNDMGHTCTAKRNNLFFIEMGNRFFQTRQMWEFEKK